MPPGLPTTSYTTIKWQHHYFNDLYRNFNTFTPNSPTFTFTIEDRSSLIFVTGASSCVTVCPGWVRVLEAMESASPLTYNCSATHNGREVNYASSWHAIRIRPRIAHGLQHLRLELVKKSNIFSSWEWFFINLVSNWTKIKNMKIFHKLQIQIILS